MSETKPESTALTEDDVRRVMVEVFDLREKISDLTDRFNNGVKYIEEENCYVLVWTQKELDDAKREAEKIYNIVFKDLPQDTTTDQAGQGEAQGESADSEAHD